MNHVVGGVAFALDGELGLADAGDDTVASSNEPAELVVRLTAIPSTGTLRPSAPPAVEEDSWSAFVDDDNVSFCLNADTRRDHMRLELSRHGHEGRYFYTNDWPYLFQYPIDQLIMIHTLGLAGGALMHAASIAGRDGALLVAGPSGMGKTTMSRATAALGAHVLSDERTIVRPRPDGSWVVGGTPWPGEGGFAENRSVPLKALILLEQASSDELVPLSRARALALLYRCHFPPKWDAAASARTLDHLERLVSELPAYLFRNRKGPEAARRLLELVGGAG